MKTMDPMAPGKPPVVTEGGLWTKPYASGVTEAAHAKLIIEQLELAIADLEETRVPARYYRLKNLHTIADKYDLRRSRGRGSRQLPGALMHQFEIRGPHLVEALHSIMVCHANFDV